VNPIAGMGGRVGLKGTDGALTLRRALELEAVPVSISRAVQALQELVTVKDLIQVMASPGEMGELEVLEAGLEPLVLGKIQSGRTTAEDTKTAIREFMREEADLILFAGGDGTARDIFSVVEQKIPVLGIPSGVKMHSSVFALNPKKAGELAALYVQNEAGLREGEVMDVDEDAFRENRLSARLYGYLLVPFKREFIQQTKSGSSSAPSESIAQRVIAEYFVEGMDQAIYILGPGTTTRSVAEVMGIKKTLLGVDVVKDRQLLCADANENDLLELLNQGAAKIVVTPIGGQGFIFGRGNQQISPEVIRRVGKKNVIVLATPNKLASLGIGATLRVDTGDAAVDQMISGYIRIITGHCEEAVLRVEP